jgi:hypothetical protein
MQSFGSESASHTRRMKEEMLAARKKDIDALTAEKNMELGLERKKAENMRMDFESKISRLRVTVIQKEEDIAAKEREIASFDARMVAESDAFERRLNAREAQLQAQLQEMQNEAKRMEEHYRAEMSSLSEREAREKERMVDEFETEQEALDRENAMLEKKIVDMETRYENRSPRPEDISLIRRLEREVEEQKAIAQKAIENMNYYKLELLNREEVFNKTFGRSPSVGVMDPLKGSRGMGGGIGGTSMAGTRGDSRLPPLRPGSAGRTRPTSGRRSSRSGH